MENIKNGLFEINLDAIVFKKAKVLIVDDIDSNRELLKAFLEQYDLELFEAENGKQAIDVISDKKCDLVLMDMRMPVMDGYEASERLKTDNNLKHIPIIAVTASSLNPNKERIIKLCDGYLRQPVSMDNLVGELIRFIPYRILEQKNKK